MNSAVEPLLKAINDLISRVSMLEAEKYELTRRINEIESNITNLQSSVAANSYVWNTSINTSINTSTRTPYWRSITEREVLTWAQSYISDLNANNDWTFTLTYSDGRTVTLGN